MSCHWVFSCSKITEETLHANTEFCTRECRALAETNGSSSSTSTGEMDNGKQILCHPGRTVVQFTFEQDNHWCNLFFSALMLVEYCQFGRTVLS